MDISALSLSHYRAAIFEACFLVGDFPPLNLWAHQGWFQQLERNVKERGKENYIFVTLVVRMP